MVASPSAAAWTARSGGVTSLDDCGGGVAVGTATLQGWRDAQEDAHETQETCIVIAHLTSPGVPSYNQAVLNHEVGSLVMCIRRLP